MQIEITFKTNLEKVQQFLLDFGKQAGVEAFKDPAGNIVFRKPATPGYENRKGIILQESWELAPDPSLYSNQKSQSP